MEWIGWFVTLNEYVHFYFLVLSFYVCVKGNMSYHLSALPWEDDGIRLTDVVEGPVVHAIITSFVINLEWLYEVCPLLQTIKVDIVTDSRVVPMIMDSVRGDTSVHAAVTPAFGTHHTKMMILFYREKVRIMITSANFTDTDWALKTQGVFVKDFPLGSERVGDDPFRDYLCEYMSHLPKSVPWERLHLADCRDAGCVLVGSVPGKHRGAEINKWGHMRLRSVLSVNADEVCCQFSSLGSLSDRWFNTEFKRSVTGDRDAVMHIVYPTKRQVIDSYEGVAAGMSLPVKAKNIKPFIRSRLCVWKCDDELRDRSMPHIKTYVGLCEGSPRWTLMTSANLSKPAWGAMELGGSQFTIKSFELGVLFTGEKTKVPFALPVKRYDEMDEPWTVMW